jgi:hypothetical protein
MVTVIFPDVVAVTRYDTAKGRWVLQVADRDPLDLEQTDSEASDEALKWEISCYPIEYQTTIDRSHLASEAAVGETKVGNGG